MKHHETPWNTMKHHDKEVADNDEKKKRVIAPVDFNPRLPKINEVFNKHFKAMLFKKPELKTTFDAPPMAALRQAPQFEENDMQIKLTHC